MPLCPAGVIGGIGMHRARSVRKFFGRYGVPCHGNRFRQTCHVQVAMRWGAQVEAPFTYA